MTDQYEGRDTLEVLKLATNYNKSILQQVLQLLPKKYDSQVHVLDFGAGIGTFASALQTRRPDVQVTAFEPDVNQCKDIIKLNAITNVYSDLSRIPDHYFDVIYSLNVLEHIEDDAQTLKLLKSKLKPKGNIYIYLYQPFKFYFRHLIDPWGITVDITKRT